MSIAITDNIEELSSLIDSGALDEELTLSEKFAKEFDSEQDEEVQLTPSQILFKILSHEKFRDFSLKNNLIMGVDTGYGVSKETNSKYLNSNVLEMIDSISQDSRRYYMEQLSSLENDETKRHEVFNHFKGVKEEVKSLEEEFRSYDNTVIITPSASKKKDSLNSLFK